MANLEQATAQPQSPDEVKQYISYLTSDSAEFLRVFWGVGLGETTRDGQTVPCVNIYVSPALTDVQRTLLPSELFGVALEYTFSSLPEPTSAAKIAKTEGLLVNAIAILLHGEDTSSVTTS